MSYGEVILNTRTAHINTFSRYVCAPPQNLNALPVSWQVQGQHPMTLAKDLARAHRVGRARRDELAGLAWQVSDGQRAQA